MEEVLLLGGFVAFGLLVWHMLTRLDRLLGCSREECREKQEPGQLHIVTSSLWSVPIIEQVFLEMQARHPGLQCTLSVGEEPDAVQSVGAGRADVAVVSPEAEGDGEIQGRRSALQARPFRLVQQGLAVRPMDNQARPQTVLWRKGTPHPLALEFVQELCGQRP